MNSSTTMRIWYAFMSIMLWTGIYLTGFSNVHWLLYIPAAASALAIVLGFCPSQVVIQKLLGAKQKNAIS